MITCLGCSKDPDIPCGKITEITVVMTGLGGIGDDLTVKMSDGSNRFAFVGLGHNYKVGDEYCNATKTTK